MELPSFLLRHAPRGLVSPRQPLCPRPALRSRRPFGIHAYGPPAARPPASMPTAGPHSLRAGRGHRCPHRRWAGMAPLPPPRALRLRRASLGHRGSASPPESLRSFLAPLAARLRSADGPCRPPSPCDCGGSGSPPSWLPASARASLRPARPGPPRPALVSGSARRAWPAACLLRRASSCPRGRSAASRTRPHRGRPPVPPRCGLEDSAAVRSRPPEAAYVGGPWSGPHRMLYKTVEVAYTTVVPT